MPTNTFGKIKTYILTHKIISIVILLIIIIGGYEVVKPKAAAGQTQYVLGTVKRGIVISSVSESGQVAASSQVSIQAQASGNITWVGVQPGDTVTAGEAIASIDDTTAKQSLADAEASLAQSQLQYEQDQAQAPINYQSSLNTLTNDQTNLTTEYNTVYNDLSTTYLDLPNVENGMQDILYGYDLNSAKSQANEDVLVNEFQNYPSVNTSVKSFEDTANSDYGTAQPEYSPAVLAYQGITRDSATSTIESILTQTIQLTTDTAQSLQSELNFIGNVISAANQYNLKLSPTVTTLQNNARTYLGTVTNDLNALLAEQKTLQSDKNTIASDQQNIALLQVGNNTAGSNPISLQITQSSLAKQEVDLANQKALLANYTVVAPFDGTISAVTAVVGASAGNVATIITNKQIATLSLNEVDVAKIALGDKVTLTFDAIDGLTITGTVAEIDPAGTVSQGVVSYNVQVAFDTQDSAVKAGMTVNAVIQTAVHQNVLYVPSTAIKTTAAGVSTVQAFDPTISSSTIATSGATGITSATPPQSIVVTTGITDNTNTEILTGVTEGQQIVTRTTTATAAKSTAAAATTRATGAGGGGFAGGAGGARAIGI